MHWGHVVLTRHIAAWSLADRAPFVVALAIAGLLGACGAPGGASPGPSARPSTTEPPLATGSLLPDGELALGRNTMTLGGVPLSFDVPSAGWIAHAYQGGLTVDKDLVGPADGLPDGASVLFWAASPNRTFTDPCHRTLGPGVGPTTADLAAAVSSVAGTEAVGPSDVTFGGHPSKAVTLTILEDAGCDPGTFYLWAAGGTDRHVTALGDQVRLWVVDVDGWRGLVEAETRKDASAGTLADLQRLVDSIRFE